MLVARIRSAAIAAARRHAHTVAPTAVSARPRVLVLGTGWSAFALVKNLDHTRFDVSMLSPRNHMVFTPLLASTAVGTLEFRSISEPVSSSFPDVHFLKAEALELDTTRKEVTVRTENITPKGPPAGERTATLPYDLLVVGVGAQNNTFGIPGVEQHMHFLKELAHAREIRRAIIRNVEAATFPGVSAPDRRRLLSFVIIGGGPTGVEFAAELHDFVMEDLVRLYPAIAPELRITVIEGKQLLGAFDQSLRYVRFAGETCVGYVRMHVGACRHLCSEYTERKFRRDRISVRTGVNVVHVDEKSVRLSDGDTLEYGLGVWNTGIGPRLFVRNLDGRVFLKDRWGHIMTDDHMRVLAAPAAAAPAPSGTRSGPAPEPASAEDTAAAPPAPQYPAASPSRPVPCVWAMGDCASVAGQHYAATAQVAEQQGTYLAKQLNALVAQPQVEREPDGPAKSAAMAKLSADAAGGPFVYRHGGSLAFIGTFSAVSDFSGGSRIAPLYGKRLHGIVAWLLWRSAYLTQLGAWRNRFQVPMDWTRTLLFGRDVTQF